MNAMTIVCIVVGLVFGLAVSYLNVLISKKFVKQSSVVGIMTGNTARLILDIAALAIGYFVCKLAGLPYVAVLVSIAIGLSVGGTLFLRLMVNKMKKDGGLDEQ